MSLQTILDEMPVSFRLPFLRSVSSSGNNQANEASGLLLNELEKDLKMGRGDTPQSKTRIEYTTLMDAKIDEAKFNENLDEINDLTFRLVTSHKYCGLIEKDVKKINDPIITRKVIDEYKSKDPWGGGTWEMVVNLMEHLGQYQESLEYGLQSIDIINERRIRGPKGSWKNHGVDNIYLKFDMFEEAVEICLDNLDFDKAISLAEKHLVEEKLPGIYQRVFNEVKGGGYHQGFPVQIMAAKKLGDETLLRESKVSYVNWLIDTGKDGNLNLIREVGTLEQLNTMHSRIVNYHVDELSCNFINSERGQYHLGCLLESAEEAYQDTKHDGFAVHVMDTAVKLGDFPKASEYANILNSPNAKLYEEAAQLMG
ncbi:hypothetical protein HN385_05230 [archaeon]|jgi:hypothetical protein|nr:hypothetical protein [archaeon]MBT3451423.1 hypothetical protein [archaeon]MBT6869232.1 hypothetical protein [archaeon]MBT7193630.1 hypothetical protein [archaeon]MBT7380248.1 hypothetical protein [archaeon]